MTPSAGSETHGGLGLDGSPQVFPNGHGTVGRLQRTGQFRMLSSRLPIAVYRRVACPVGGYLRNLGRFFNLPEPVRTRPPIAPIPVRQWRWP